MIRWTPEEIEFIRLCVRKNPVKDVPDLYLKTYGRRISHDQVKGVMARYGIKTGRTGRFAPGNRPWNDGLKGWKSGGRSVETRFKPGELRGAAKSRLQPLGAERLTKNGVRQRKIRMDGPPQRRWKSVHSLLWEEHNGPIPSGHVVIFIDGDHDNITLDNLALVSRAELAILNKRGWNDLPASLRPAAIKAVKLQRMIRNKEHELNQDSQA